MEYPALEKFIETLGLKVTIELNSAGLKQTFKKFVCCHIVVSREKKVEYSQYHCYVPGIEGPKYLEGNQEIGVRDGILAYLGDENKIDNYFEQKTRNLAKEYFDK